MSHLAFLPESLKQSRKRKRYMFRTCFFLLGAGCLLAALLLPSHVRLGHLRTEQEQLLQKVKRAEQENSKSITAEAAEQQRKDHQQKAAAQLLEKQRKLSSEAMHALLTWNGSGAQKENSSNNLQLESTAYEAGKISALGKASSWRVMVQYVSYLEQLPQFTKIRLLNVERTASNGTIKFSLRLRLKEE